VPQGQRGGDPFESASVPRVRCNRLAFTAAVLRCGEGTDGGSPPLPGVPRDGDTGRSLV
jgi:hypothetical protein